MAGSTGCFILAGTLLITPSIGLFAAAWKGRSVTAMNTNPIMRKLLVDAFCTAPSALVFGFCLVRSIQHFDSLSLTATVLFGACLIPDLLYTRHECGAWPVRRTDIDTGTAFTTHRAEGVTQPTVAATL
jgi:hypothetical protein